MPVKQLRIKLVAFILIESIVIIVVVNLYLSSSNEKLSSSEVELQHSDKLTRDYVINQQAIDSKPDIVIPLANTLKKFGQANIYTDNVESLRIKGYKCVDLKTFRGTTPICVYPRQMDNMISAHVTDFHTWEEDWLNATAEILAKHDDFVYLDLGCNIGVYTLFVAKLGISVYSVDPNINNLRLLKKSLRLGNLQSNVTIILNAISDERVNATLEIVEGNIGGSVINSKHTAKKEQNNKNIVETITLDDLGNILSNKKVFIKMDIESYELNAIKGAHNFFQTVDVRYIQMEWTHFRYNEKGQIITDSLIKHGLFPFSDVHGREPLHPDQYYSWPENIVWIKR